MKKRTAKVEMFVLFVVLMIGGILLPSRDVSAASKNVYGLVIGAYSGAENDYELMYDRIVNSSLEGYSSKSSVTKFFYDQEDGTGITIDKMDDLISSSMEGATSSDIFYFYYSGHSVTSSSGSSIGISLCGQNGTSSLQYTWKKLAKSLSAFPGKIVVILDTCHAEAFYKQGVTALSTSKQKRFYCLLSCGTEETSGVTVSISPRTEVGTKTYGQFTRAIGTALGFWNGDAVADTNSDGVVTLKELYSYTKYHTVGFSLMTVKKYGSDTKLFRYPVSLSKTSLTLYVDQTKTLKTYVTGNKVSAKWKSSDKSIVKVSSKGKLTAKKKGTATITATYNGTSATCKVTVKNPSTTLNKSSASITIGKTLTLKATVKGASSKITWSSNKKSVATVNSSGKVTAKKVGTATITAKANGKSASCKITVKPSVTLNKTSATLVVGKKLTLKATLKGTSDKVTWSSTKKSVAKVSSSGKVTAVKAGTAYIKAKAGGVTAKCKIKVKSSVFAGGSGTKSDPYLVSSASQFKKIADYNGCYFKQTKNIDFNGATLSSLFPNSTNSSMQGFTGTYNGNGYTLSNFILDHVYSNLNTSYRIQGLFGNIMSGGVVKNLTLKNVKMSSEGVFASYIADYNYGTISNCTVDNCTYSGSDIESLSGICVYNFGKIKNCTVSNCTFTAKSVCGIANMTFDGSLISGCTFKDSTVSSQWSSYGIAMVDSVDDLVTDCSVSGVSGLTN